jgi:uncharacterized small protein (DUF1192 family)
MDEFEDEAVYNLPVHFAARNEIRALRTRIAELEQEIERLKKANKQESKSSAGSE